MIIITAMILVIADVSKLTVIITTSTFFMAFNRKYFALHYLPPRFLLTSAPLNIGSGLIGPWLLIGSIGFLSMDRRNQQNKSLDVTFTPKLGRSSCALHTKILNSDLWQRMNQSKNQLQMVLISAVTVLRHEKGSSVTTLSEGALKSSNKK